MNTDLFIESLFASLVSGNRNASRRLVETAIDHDISADTIAREVFWPTINNITTIIMIREMKKSSRMKMIRMQSQSFLPARLIKMTSKS